VDAAHEQHDEDETADGEHGMVEQRLHEGYLKTNEQHTKVKHNYTTH
jgi:hypothetical protein